MNDNKQASAATRLWKSIESVYLVTLDRRRPFLAVFCLSVTFGATMGFLTVGAPLVLRVRGVELGQIGLLQLIALPIGLTFLWAHQIDRRHLPRLPHRLGWIVLMQSIAILLLASLAFGETWPLLPLFIIAIGCSLCVATMDVAFEALVVETVGASERPLVVTTKFCGAALGTMLGAGLLIARFEHLGWRNAVLCLAGLALLCLVPILYYPERALRRPEAIQEREAASLDRIRFLGGKAAVIGLYFAGIFALTGLNGLALIDLGIPIATASTVTGSIAPGANIVMAVAAGLLIRRLGALRTIAGASGLVLLVSGLMLVACALRLPNLAIVATVSVILASAALGVPVFTMIYRWAQGPRAALDYSLLFGAAFLSAIPMRVGAPAIAAKTGWPVYYALAMVLFMTAFLVLRIAIQRTPAEAPPAD